MIKYILIYVLLLSACSLQEQQGEISIEEKNKYIVDDIFSYMNPWSITESHLYNPIREIHSLCVGKDFVSYRECFIFELNTRQASIMYTSLDIENIGIFIQSLKNEIQYYPYYKKIDKFRYPDFQKIVSVEGIPCHIIASGEKQRQMNKTEFYTPEKIILSYSENIGNTLLRYFPSWSGSQIYDAKSYSGYGYDPDHPCLYRTFGPAVGNIVYATEDSDLLYLFVKDSDGGGSGEFIYFIYVYNKITRQLEVIGNMWIGSGFFPFSQRYTETEGTEKITEFYKNWPFLHEINYDHRTISGEGITQLLERSIQ